MKIALIGSRDPSQAQREAVKRAIVWIKANHPGAKVASNCATGVAELAMTEARTAGLATIGYVPWSDYNSEVQKFCDQVVCLADIPDPEKKEAWQSVLAYHPTPQALAKGPKALNGCCFLVVQGSDLVIALPPDKEGGGVTEQGIRLALGNGAAIWCIDSHGVKIDAAKYRIEDPVESAPKNQIYACDDCDWKVIVAPDDDPTTTEGACPGCGSHNYTIMDVI